MEDSELDELLDRWGAPTPAVELREKVRNAFRPPRKAWRFGLNLKPMVAGTALGACLGMMLLITQAFPQTIRLAAPWFQVPYTVESEFVDYDEHGTPKINMYSTSYTDKGREILLSSSIPGSPLVSAVRRVLETTGFLWYRIAGRDQWAGAADFVRSGCVNQGQLVVERITILGYPTVAVQTPDQQGRMTLWMAPDLGCFALRIRNEERQTDGSFRVVSEKHALAVTGETGL